MQHFALYPGSTFACGADAFGQRNSLLDQDTSKTTCERCKATEAWLAHDARVRAMVAAPVSGFSAGETVTYDGNRFGTVVQTTTELIGHEGAVMVQVKTAYHNLVWFEAGYLAPVAK